MKKISHSRTASKERIVDLKNIDKALKPYEKKLRAQEKFRRSLGVREVARPTYEKYIIGDIKAVALFTAEGEFLATRATQ